MRRSLWFRLLVTSLVWISIALGLTWVGLGRLFDDHVGATYQRQLADRLNLLAASFEWDGRGQLVLSQAPADPRYVQPYSGKYWQVDAADGTALERSRSLWDQRLTLPLPTSPIQGLRVLNAVGPQQQQLLLVERSLSLPGNDQPVRIAVAMDRAELIAARREFDHLLGLSLTGLAIGLSLLIVAQIAIALRPLRRLRQSLALLRRRSSRELEGDWPHEIAPLVTELNALLARDAATIERSRRQAADLAHGLKTPLAILGNLATQAPSPSNVEQLGAQTAAMRRQIDRHLARARAVGRSGLGGPLTDAGRAVREVLAAMATLHRDRLLSLNIDGQGSFEGDRQDLIEMCGNLLENACSWARQRVDVQVDDDGHTLTIRIEDDGPGMTDTQISAALQGNVRMDQRSPGSGLGLAICVDIASLYGGRLALARGSLPGLQATLILPRAVESPLI